MSDESLQSNMSTPNPEGQKRRRWHMLLFLLFIFMLMTSCVAGYILGKGSKFSEDSPGKEIDTIHVSRQDTEARIHLGGKIFYSDGTPYSKGLVQLHSEPKRTVTDEKGAFVFKDAESGEHTISILDSEGNTLAEREISISKEEIAKGANIKFLNNQKYQVEVSVDIKYLEVQVEINKEDGKLYINPDKITYLTEDGIVVSPTGKADIKKGAVVTPMGNVITTDGTIICGSGENGNQKVIIPSGNLEHKEDGSIVTPDGTQVRPDGTVVINNTVIDTRGISVTGDGRTREPGEGGYQILEKGNTVDQVPIGSETEKLIGNSGKEQQNSQEQGDNNQTGGITPGGNSTGTIPSGQAPGTNTPGTNTPGADVPGTDIPQTPADDGPDNGVQITRGTSADNLSVWEQNAQIDLFYNRTSGVEDKTLIAPGAEGYYLFRLSNDNHFAISVSLAVSGSGLDLPLEFAIADSNGKLLTSWAVAAGQTEVSTGAITLKNRGEKLYQIKWRWPYYTSEGQDVKDTQAGEQKDRTCMVNLSVRAREQ